MCEPNELDSTGAFKHASASLNFSLFRVHFAGLRAGKGRNQARYQALSSGLL